jgi:phage baseplate assembly protein W
MEKINPVWTMFARAIYPTLKPRTMEPEYALYAYKTRVRVEKLERIEPLVNFPGECF